MDDVSGLPFLPGMAIVETSVGLFWWAVIAVIVVIVCAVVDIGSWGKKWWPPRLAAFSAFAATSMLIAAIIFQMVFDAR
ncbi:hypothetical protein [Agromyces humi]|uniref:hypothetical protein n=1 Tax=Agromyces humi TaxID=1766800 RepID=UPI00135B9D95|nr:hypothetical protein [Agromyces humi]